MVSVSLEDVAPSFPEFRVAAVVAEDLMIPAERDAVLDALIGRRENAVRERFGATALADIAGIAAWRRAYRAFGIKQTRYRSAVERLVKNALAGRALPAVNALVDLYNAVSLSHVLPLGADDLDHVVGPVAFRFAREGDSFVDMTDLDEDGDVVPEAPKAGEVVYADAAKILCRRWNWRQDGRSLITPTTRRALITLQSNGTGDVAEAAVDLMDLIERHCSGSCRMAVLDRTRPTLSL